MRAPRRRARKGRYGREKLAVRFYARRERKRVRAASNSIKSHGKMSHRARCMHMSREWLRLRSWARTADASSHTDRPAAGRRTPSSDPIPRELFSPWTTVQMSLFSMMSQYRRGTSPRELRGRDNERLALPPRHRGKKAPCRPLHHYRPVGPHRHPRRPHRARRAPQP